MKKEADPDNRRARGYPNFAAKSQPNRRIVAKTVTGPLSG
jgi:hypothetical protein